MKSNAEKILITGANGFIGSHVTHRLFEDGNEVHIILRRDANTDRIKDILPKLKVHQGDLTDADFLKRQE